MLLEIIIALLLGGLFYVLVRQHNSKPTKSFKVTDGKSTLTVLLKYTSFESFSEKCRAKFDLGKNEKLQFSSGEDENIALDEDCIKDLEDNSLLIVKGETDSSEPNDDFITGAEDNIELDERCKGDSGDKSSLILKGETYSSGAKVDNDGGVYNDNLEFEILGSDSAGYETVVEDADIKKWEDIEKGRDVKEHISKYGLKNITNVLKENLTAWKSKPLNIAVTGESGKGKSAFINAFRGLSPWQEGAAEVAEEECTRYCRAFRHPKYDSFVLWDVPGVGTITFPKEEYLNAIQIGKFDFFIIISSSRFSELDSWLAKEILKREKGLYFIRTKVDIDMSEKKTRFRKGGQDFCEKEEFNKMKTGMSQKLYSDLKVETLPFFMISNHHPNKYDFPLILNKLLQDVGTEKKAAMLFGLAGMSRDILEEKASALKSRIWKVALLSGIKFGITVQFSFVKIDIEMILKEVLFYREQFGLDDQSLEHLADMAGISLNYLKNCVKFSTPAAMFTSAGLANHLMKYATRANAETVVKYSIPVYGLSFPCCISYHIMMLVLQEILNNLKGDALNVLMHINIKGTETHMD